MSPEETFRIEDRWFYADPNNLDALSDEVDAWKGTRFFKRARGASKRGVFADCITYTEGLHRGTGGIRSAINWPRYVTHQGGKSMEDLLIASVESLDEIDVIWRHGELGDPYRLLMMGDWLMTSKGGNFHHTATYIGDNTVTHCWEDHGVCEGNIHDRDVKQFLKRIWRIKAHAPSR